MTNEERLLQGFVKGEELSGYSTLVKAMIRLWGVTPFGGFGHDSGVTLSQETLPGNIDYRSIIYDNVYNMFLVKSGSNLYYKFQNSELYNDIDTSKGSVSAHKNRFFACKSGYIVMGEVFQYDLSPVLSQITGINNTLSNHDTRITENHNRTEVLNGNLFALTERIRVTVDNKLAPFVDISDYPLWNEQMSPNENLGKVCIDADNFPDISLKKAVKSPAADTAIWVNAIDQGTIYVFHSSFTNQDIALTSDSSGSILRPIGMPRSADESLNLDSHNAVANSIVTKTIRDNEKVWAEAFNDLNERTLPIKPLVISTVDRREDIVLTQDMLGKYVAYDARQRVAFVAEDNDGLYTRSVTRSDMEAKMFVTADGAYYILDAEGTKLKGLTNNTFDTILNDTSNNAPTTQAVKNYVESRIGSILEVKYYAGSASTLVVPSTKAGALYLCKDDMRIYEIQSNGSKKALTVALMIGYMFHVAEVDMMFVLKGDGTNVVKEIGKNVYDTSINSTSTNAPTTKAVYEAVGAAGKVDGASFVAEDGSPLELPVSSKVIQIPVDANAPVAGNLRLITSDAVARGISTAKSDLDAKITALESSRLKREVVDALPDSPSENTIYLVPVRSQKGDYYNEYLWVASKNAYELIGTSQTSLEGYTTQAELNRLKASTTGLSVFIEKGSNNYINILLKDGDKLVFVDTNKSIGETNDIYIDYLNDDGTVDTNDSDAPGGEITVENTYNKIDVRCEDMNNNTAYVTLFIKNNTVTNVGIPVLTKEDIKTIWNNA
jgi:hypothetical protein